MNEEKITSGTLEIGEVHPSAHNAFEFIKEYLLENKDLFTLKESLASCAISGNRLAEVCGETLNRIYEGKPVSDRYVLGLAWFLKEMSEAEYHVEKPSENRHTGEVCRLYKDRKCE